MRTGLYQVYWRLSHELYDRSYAPPKAFKWEFTAAFVDPEDADFWIRQERNSRERETFEYKIMHKGRNYTYKPGD